MSELPESFVRRLAALEASYLERASPIERSGFGGGAFRWRAEREPILDAVDRDGHLLDLGCANGHLAECLVAWGRERGRRLVPWGVDIGAQLIAEARRRLPEHADHFFVDDVFAFSPPRRFDFVYSLYDCVPHERLGEYIERVLARCVAPGGRLILGAYGSRSRKTEAFDVAGFLRAAGFDVVGTARGGDPAVTAFAWVDEPG